MISKHLLNVFKRPLTSLRSYQTYLSRSTWSSSAVNQGYETSNTLQHTFSQHKNKNEDENTNRSYRYSSDTMSYLPVVPLLAIMALKLNKASCLFGIGGNSKGPEKDKLTGRIAVIQYPSNNPIEDRWAVHQLETIAGYVTMVFDGHGGWQVAEYAMANLPKEIENALKANKNKKFANDDEYISTSLKEAFDTVENGFLEIARAAYGAGFAGIGKVGACALVTLVHGNKVYAANAGDCQGVICKNEKGKVTFRRTNSKLNANSKKEQRRLKEQFSDEKDIYICKRGDSKACYVKGRLQPTRAFGDFHLKHAEFNNPKDLGTEYGYRKKLGNFKGSYITHEPLVKIFELEKDDKYLIISSDGMWDELSKPDVAGIVEKNLGDKQKLTNELLDNAIAKAASSNRMSEKEIRDLPLGTRRNHHDDMTIIVVDLENQGK